MLGEKHPSIEGLHLEKGLEGFPHGFPPCRELREGGPEPQPPLWGNGAEKFPTHF